MNDYEALAQADGPKPDGSLSREAALEALRCSRPVFWRNLNRKALSQKAPGLQEIQAAEARLRRWAPALSQLFPELAVSGGIIESDLESMPVAAGLAHGCPTFIKADDRLPIVGSIKARGGFYEILLHAELLAERAGIFASDEDPLRLVTADAHAFFAKHNVAVGSTGNLGLSIGTLAAALGFRATVHMSRDAKTWKKSLLRERGAEVIEHVGDYAAAVAAGRAATATDPRSYFVDDENSLDLFIGYATASLRVKRQLEAASIEPTPDRPLLVYLPCGVGGAPGGITLGLDLLYGDAVRCYFGEPVASPSFLLRMLCPERALSVYDIGLNNCTAADGLSVARGSQLVFDLIGSRVAGAYTATDRDLIHLVDHLYRRGGFKLEPSAAMAFLGHSRNELAGSACAAIFWATGGSLTPDEEFEAVVQQGAEIIGWDTNPFDCDGSVP